jgi:Starch-binding associating with outer membrane
MRIEAERTNAPVYAVLAKFFKAWCFIELTNQVGDIPMSDALKGTLGNYTPVYDTQKDIFKACLTLLDEANSDMNSLLQTNPNIPIDGDLIYNGSAIKWQKLFNSYKLRVLIDLSKKEVDADLSIKTQFANIFNNPSKYPVFTANEDGAVFNWYDKEGNRYPRYYVPTNMDYYRFSSTYMQYITQYNDPRIFVVGRMSQVAQDAGKQPTDITAYAGINSGLAISDIYNKKDSGSALNVDRYSTVTGEPMIIVGYPELNFNIAEAINRGWIAGDANSYYQKGIQASMQFYQSNGGSISDAQIIAYLAQPSVQYGGSLNNILIQKYLAYFNNSGWESFYNIRRTGVPALSVGPGNGNNNQIPTRWQYPQAEYQYNQANVKAACQRQFNGSDDRNGVLWINQ